MLPKILVVDDDDDIIVMLETILSQEFEVLTARDGAQAIETLRAGQVDGVVCDHMMPGMTGVEVLDRALELQPSAARVLITASDRVNVLRDAVNRARVHRFLSKPLRLGELAQVVDGAIREARLEAEHARLVLELSHKNEELARINERLELEVSERTRELSAVVAELEQLAMRDGLTGLYNHRYFQEALEIELSRAERYAQPLSLLFIDVDHFKHYNDRNGHPAGDRLLKRLASALMGGRSSGVPLASRKSDVVARYGGEEFVMLLPQTPIDGARVKAQRIVSQIGEYPFEHAEGQPAGRVSVSIGVACYPDHAQDKQSLIAAADKMLYRAKHEGRGRVCSP